MAHAVDGVAPSGAVDRSLWWLGWHPLISLVVGGAVGLVIGNGLAIPIAALTGLLTFVTMSGFVVIGMVLGGLTWYFGARRINDQYVGVLTEFESGSPAGDGAATTYAFVGDGNGSKPLLDAHRHYDSTYLLVDSEALTVYRGGLDLVAVTPRVESGHKFPYEHLADVSAMGSDVRITTTEGEVFDYPAPGDPSVALADVRDRCTRLRDGAPDEMA